MSPFGTDNQRGSRARARTARLRTAAALAGLGVVAALPLSIEAATGGPVTRGQVFTPSKDTPAAVTSALKGSGPVVVAFLLPGITEDELVQKRINRLRKESSYRDTTFVVYRITGATKLGDLPERLGITYTPAVAVLQSDDKLSAVWRGLVDEDIIAQSIIDARGAVPQAVTLPTHSTTPKGNKEGVALAKKVIAAYKKVPGLKLQGSATNGGQKASFAYTVRLQGGRIFAQGTAGTLNGKKFEDVLNRTGYYSRAEGASCWTRSTAKKDIKALNSFPLDLDADVYMKPVRKGGTIELPAVDGKEKGSYMIDAKTFLITSIKTTVVDVTFENLKKAPAIASPDKIC